VSTIVPTPSSTMNTMAGLHRNGSNTTQLVSELVKYGFLGSGGHPKGTPVIVPPSVVENPVSVQEHESSTSVRKQINITQDRWDIRFVNEDINWYIVLFMFELF
jgi:uncharacterized 2Fe-2S/4Fe-4S cluster protein (DUF4445 family)